MTTNLGARISTDETLTIAINASVSNALDMQDYAGGIILLPVDFQGYVHFEVSHDGVTFAPLVDEFGAAVIITQLATPATVALWAVIPDKCFACGWLKVKTYQGITRASAQTQTAARTLRVRLKS